MQQATRVCFYCLHKLWLLLAIGLVLLATLVSLLRLALPYADDYKHHLEQLIAGQLGTPVQIGQINAGWQKLGPAMVLEQMQIGDPSQGTPLLIQQTRVRFNFWQSLRSMQLRAEHFELSGLQYRLSSSSLLSSPTASPTNVTPVVNALEQLFFRQLNHFTLLDSELVLTAQGSDDIVVSVQKLDWRNDGEHHQGIGELAIADVTANTLSFIIDLYGPTLDQAFGQIFLESSQLDVLPWFRQWLPETERLAQADINFQAWGRVEQGDIQRFQIELADNSLSWQRQGEAHQLKLGPGQLLWQPRADGWALYSGSLALSDGKASWPDLTLQLQRHASGWQGQLQQLKLDAIAPLSQLLSDELPQLARLTRIETQGKLSRAQWQFSASDDWQLQGEFNALSTTASNDLPGVSGLSGQFWGSPKAAGLTFSGTQGELNWPGMFSAPIHYDQLQIGLLARQSSLGDWQIQLPVMQLQGADLQLTGSMQWSVLPTPQLSLFAELTDVSAADAERYLPLRYLPEQVRQYLSGAIVDGELTQARVLWQGAPGDFPFNAAEGIFQVDATVEQARFSFNPDWPALQQLNSSLWFENASMQIATTQANIGKLALQGQVSATIPDLFDASQLIINIDTALELSQASQLIDASPLANNLGKVLQQLSPTGSARAAIELQVGLREPVVQVNGKLALQDISLDLATPPLAIRQLAGELQFTDSQISGSDLHFRWRDLAASADIRGEQLASSYQFSLDASGQNGSVAAMQALWPDAAERVAGELDWRLALGLQLQADSFTYQSSLFADLTTTELLLPAPYAKDAVTVGHLQLQVNGDSERSNLQLNYADQLYFSGELDHTKNRFQRVNLSLGPENAGLNASPFSIDVNLARAELLPWQQLISQQFFQGNNAENSLFPPLSKVRGRIGNLQLVAGTSLNNTVFELEPDAGQWQLRLHGTEIASRWFFSHDWQQRGVTAQIDYLHLPFTAPETAAPIAAGQLQTGLLTMPPIALTCNDCSIGNYRLGKVSLAASGQSDHWQLDHFHSNYKQNRLEVSGSWQPDPHLGTTRLSGHFVSPNIGALLNEFQLTTGISGSEADIAFDLNWPAAPNQFELATLNGQVGFSLGDGALTEVSDQGARLFSIFSLDSLVRKLRLDFRDVFSKGFFYNKMSGNLALHQGVVQTSNTTIDGVPGNLAIQGYADLVSTELDYQMSFSPKVTSSLPVIIAWMVNPATGLAALALDEVFQSAEVISRINFTVTGSFEQPVVTEVNRHSTEVPVPVRIAQPEAVIDDPEEYQPRGD